MSAPARPQVRPGSLEEAVKNGRALLRHNPSAALAQAHAILRRDARNADALRLAAAAHRSLGEKGEAERAELTAIQAGQSVPQLKLAAQALEDSNPEKARKLIEEYLARNPDDLTAQTISAECELLLGNPGRAESIIRKVLERVSRFAPARNLLMEILVRQDKLRDVLSLVDTMLGESPDDLNILKLRAKTLGDLGDFIDAAATYERMLELDDRVVRTWIAYGDVLRFIGRKVESRLAYERALRLDPDSGRAWWSLVNLDPNLTDADFVQLNAAVEKSGNSPEQAWNLHFALGAVHDARGSFRDAFRHYAAGNDLRKQAQPYDPAEITKYVDASLRQDHRTQLQTSRKKFGPASQPIFLVGMPRSGSTLVERIIGNHSAVEPLGELPLIPHVVAGMRLPQDDKLAAKLATLSARTLRDQAEFYLDRASQRRKSDVPYFTDKMHMNWRHVPHILRMFPDTRVLDVRRSALDCCWSNYKTLFAKGHPASSDLSHIGLFYRDYVRMMDRMADVAPDRILQVRYEDAVDNLEAQTRRILDFLGLEFEPQCLDFHLSTEPVATASSEQVRRPLNREGIGAWKPYRQWLGPLIEALGPLAEPELADA